jgi:ribosomal protein S18 acetylase RimI-like enzyme
MRYALSRNSEIPVRQCGYRLGGIGSALSGRDLGGREGDKVRRAFENSTVVCFAMDGPRLVGAARALSDHEYHATVYDVVVHPEYQRRGLGSRLMGEMLALLPVWRVLLVADGDAKRFYQRLGFEPFGDVLALVDRAKLYDRD